MWHEDMMTYILLAQQEYKCVPTAESPDDDTWEIRRDLRGKRVCIKTRHGVYVYLEIRDQTPERKCFPRISGDSFWHEGNALFFFIGPTQQERRRRKCFGRKCTRVKALAFPLYDLTRIYGPLPGIAFPILCYISVGNPSRFSSLVMRSVETHPMLRLSLLNVNTLRKFA